MTDKTPITLATEDLWRATRNFMRAMAEDPDSEPALLVRLGQAHEAGIMIALAPTPRIWVAGSDTDGRFSKLFELLAHGSLN